MEPIDRQLPPEGRSRRRLITGISVGAAAAAVPGMAYAESADRDRRQREGDDGGRSFTRLFGALEPFADATDDVRAALMAVGASGGIMDGGDEQGDVDENPDHASMPSGFTFFGQFIDHDLTRDAGSRLGTPTGVRGSENLRTARFDLDAVYGRDPARSPELYEQADPFRLRVETGGRFEDVPRDEDGTAVVGDDRNDENLIVSQLHAAFLLFHNQVLDRVRASGLDGEAAFVEARRLVRWHHQWVVVHDVLPAYVGQTMADAVLGGDVRAFTADRPAIPVEFQTAAYRFGHSLVRPGYVANSSGNDGEPFAAPIFDADVDPADPDPDDLSGGHRVARRFVDWQRFFDFGDGAVTNSKRIDTRLSGPLMNLPLRVVDSGRAEGPGPTSLAARNLLRHLTWGIPSGQDVAAALGVDPLAEGDLADLAPFGAGLQSSTPLFFYVLREATVQAEGRHLGEVGGRIVAEVFIELLRRDRSTYLAAEPGWTPTLPSASGAGSFTIADLLTVAGVDPASRSDGVNGGGAAQAPASEAQTAELFQGGGGRRGGNPNGDGRRGGQPRRRRGSRE